MAYETHIVKCKDNGSIMLKICKFPKPKNTKNVLLIHPGMTSGADAGDIKLLCYEANL